jgi:ComF family protein
MFSLLEKIKILFLDTLFPIHCLSCQKEGEWICSECFKKIKILDLQICPHCEKVITENGKLCPSCKNSLSYREISFPLDALLVSTKYKENNLSKFIHFFKYNFVRDLSLPLGKIMTNCFSKNSLPLPDIIIPIPLHPRRLRWRDFNQSELLAKYLSQNLAPGIEIPMESNLLRRKRFTQPQMKIKNYAERKENIKNAFSITQSKKIKDSNILLVDDVCTTGSTLLECAKILKKNGARKVFAIVIARQEIL